MFVHTLAQQPTPLGSICRELDQPHVRDRLRLLCLARITGSMKGYQLTDFEAGIVAAANGRLERFRRPFRILGLPPTVRQHHIELRWGHMEAGVLVEETQSVNLYPPSKRKPADEADAEPEVALAAV